MNNHGVYNLIVLFIFFLAGCGHCKKMKPEYEKAAEVLHVTSDVS